MNKYYHDFSIGFNWWMVLLVVSVVVMIIVGRSQYELRRRDGKLRIFKMFSSKRYYLIVSLLTVAFTVLFLKESWRGVIQMFDNSLSYTDSPVYSLLLLVVILPFGMGFYAYFLSMVGKFAATMKLDKLREKRRDMMNNDDNDPWV